MFLDVSVLVRVSASSLISVCVCVNFLMSETSVATQVREAGFLSRVKFPGFQLAQKRTGVSLHAFPSQSGSLEQTRYLLRM